MSETFSALNPETGEWDVLWSTESTPIQVEFEYHDVFVPPRIGDPLRDEVEDE